jgi:nicotinate phosphoribosyltransferase
MPDNCVFLVDTYDTLDGVRHAIEVGRELRARGHELLGVRLDSGDLAYLSIEARKLLDEAGFPNAQIVASNDLDEQLIISLNEQGARIDQWGVGTKLATAYDQPALGGVYKLGAVREDGVWRPKLKLSEQPIKISNPGILGVTRFTKEGALVADVIHEEALDGRHLAMFDPELGTPSSLRGEEYDASEVLLSTALDRGTRVRRHSLDEARARATRELAALSPRTRRFLNPQPHRVGIDAGTFALKQRLIEEARR